MTNKESLADLFNSTPLSAEQTIQPADNSPIKKEQATTHKSVQISSAQEDNVSIESKEPIPTLDEQPKGKHNNDIQETVQQNRSENTPELSVTDQVIGKIYRTVKHNVVNHTKSAEKTTKSKKPKKDNYKKGSTQNIIPVSGIKNGIIKTTTGTYVKILEVLPINFENRTIMERDDIAKRFSRIFQNGPTLIHLKCITDTSNPERLISYIKDYCEKENMKHPIGGNMMSCVQDVIKKIRSMSESSSITTRYFIIYKYEGLSNNFEEIWNDMQSTKKIITDIYTINGNGIIDYGYENDTLGTAEILYYALNRNTSHNETLQQRINRVVKDYELYNSSVEDKYKKEIPDVDFIASKGIHFTNHKYVYEDGMYKTYLAIKDNGHPTYAEPGWISSLYNFGPGTELDVWIQRLNKKLVTAFLQKSSQLGFISARNQVKNRDKQSQTFNKARNRKYMEERLNHSEDVYYVMYIITLTAESIQALKILEKTAIKKLNNQHFYVEPTYGTCWQYYLATLPLMELPRKIFMRNRRNYLTSSLESIYMYTSTELTDPTGCVLGYNESNSSIFAVNLFNTNLFANANMSILGMSGSGKTYSTQVLARSMRISGKRVFIICPIKARDFRRGCKAIDGRYYRIGPGSNHVINVCDILDMQTADKSLLDYGASVEDCCLVRQITFLLTWIKLNMEVEGETMSSAVSDILEVELTKMYYDFGITKDNKSLYNSDGTKKIMPIIGDIYDRCAEISELSQICRVLKKYITGPCSNMNAQTNIDLDNEYIVFDVDKRHINPKLLPSFILIVTNLVSQLMMQSRLKQDVLFMDEIWNIIKYKTAGDLILETVKVIRGYGGSIIPITQDINDYMGSACGKSILSNTAIKLIMYLEPTEAKRVANELNLSESDVNRITHFTQGEAMFISSKIKEVIYIQASEKEDREFTTDPNRLKELAAQGYEI